MTFIIKGQEGGGALKDDFNWMALHTQQTEMLPMHILS